MSGRCEGFIDVNSLDAVSNDHEVFLPAQPLKVFAVEAMPSSINLGQTQVVPLSLTFTNEGGPTASAVDLRSLTVRVEDEGGVGIIPSDLFARVVVNEGTNVYLDHAPETSGAELNLVLNAPAFLGVAPEDDDVGAAKGQGFGDGTAVTVCCAGHETGSSLHRAGLAHRHSSSI